MILVFLDAVDRLTIKLIENFQIHTVYFQKGYPKAMVQQRMEGVFA